MGFIGSSHAGGLAASGGRSAVSGGSGATALGGSTPYVTANASPCVESMCTSGGWCWLNPLPQGNSLFDVTVHDGEFWATGEDGLVLRGDGKHWLRCPTPTTESLRGSWFDPNGTLWVVGTGGVILSFDGSTWTQHYSEAALFLNDVHGTSGSDVWAVGDDVALHFDGTRWDRHALQTEGTVYCVWAHAVDDVWVGGTEVWHFNGTEWGVVSRLSSDARGIWGDENGTVWLAAGDIVHCDHFDCQSTPTLSDAQFDIWGATAHEIWSIGAAGGMHWDGVSWAPIDVPQSLTSAAGGVPFGLVAVGHFGHMFQRVGNEWVKLRRAVGSVWTDVWGVADDDIWISGNSMAHFDGRALVVTPTPTIWGLQAVHGTAGTDVWAVGCNGTLIHWGGEWWQDYSLQLPAEQELCFFAVWVESPRSAWATGSAGAVYHWDGSAWQQVPSLPGAVTSKALFGLGGQVFAADDTGSLVAWQQPGWQPLATFATGAINAMWGASSDDLWLASEGSNRGYLVHWSNGTAYQEKVAATKLTDVWGTSARDVWATGDGRVFHFDGEVLAEQPSGANIDKSSIWVSPTGVRWMVGGNSILRHEP